MSFELNRDWNTIKDAKHNFNWFKPNWKYEWGSDLINASIMFEAIKLVRPKTIIETGTFEGHGTYIIAKALNDIKHEATIYTIDYDNDPTTDLDHKDWEDLKNIREKNLAIIRNQFRHLTINYLHGDSRIILPKLFKTTLDDWDFFYQDSMHFFHGIQAEWNALKGFASSKAVAVFDDISLLDKDFKNDGDRFCYNFINSKDADNWDYMSTDKGHHQFWIQKK